MTGMTKGDIMSKVKKLRKNYGPNTLIFDEDILDFCDDVEAWIKSAKAPPGWFDRRSYMRTYMREWREKRRVAG